VSRRFAPPVGLESTDQPRRINSHNRRLKLAPAVGFEPTTNRLTADRSTTELRWNNYSEQATYNYSSSP
jgi:hypothetical protein